MRGQAGLVSVVVATSVVLACGGPSPPAGALAARPCPEPAPPRTTSACPCGALTSPAPSASAAASAAPDPDRPIPRTYVILTPGVGIGPIRLGMRRHEVEALGVLHRHPKYAAETEPYKVEYDKEGRVVRVAVSLLAMVGDLQVGAKTVPRGARFSEVRQLLDDCSKPSVGFGGGTYTCNDGAILILGGSGSPNEAWVVMPPPD